MSDEVDWVDGWIDWVDWWIAELPGSCSVLPVLRLSLGYLCNPNLSPWVLPPEGGVTAHGRGGAHWALGAVPTQPIPGFCDFHDRVSLEYPTWMQAQSVRCSQSAPGQESPQEPQPCVILLSLCHFLPCRMRAKDWEGSKEWESRRDSTGPQEAGEGLCDSTEMPGAENPPRNGHLALPHSSWDLGHSDVGPDPKVSQQILAQGKPGRKK